MISQRSICQQFNLAMVDAFVQLKKALIRYQEYFGDLDPVKYQLWTSQNGVESLVKSMCYNSIFTSLVPTQEKLYTKTRCSQNPIQFDSSSQSLKKVLRQEQIDKNKQLRIQIFESYEASGEQMQLNFMLESSQNKGKFLCEQRYYSQKIQQHEKIQRVSNEKNLKRGPYKSYTEQQKMKAVEMFNRKTPITKISKNMGIPCKNIKRWAQYGIQRKIGAGRKRCDPLMEEKLSQWIFQTFQKHSLLSTYKIQQQALIFSHDKNFKASRGWLTKFLDRYSIRQIYQVN